MELYAGFMGFGPFLTDVYLNLPNPTFCLVPISPILGFIIRTYKKVGFGRLR